MLDAQGGGQEEESACRGSDRSRPRSAWFSCWRPVQASPRRRRPPHRSPPAAAPAPAPSAAPSEAAPSAEAPSQAAACATDGKFKGANVNILTFNGPQVAEPLQRRAPDWECLTGGHVNVVAVGFQTIYDKALLDASTGTNAFDAYVFNPQWLGDFVGPGYLADLTDRVNNDPQLDWQDIGPFFRDFNATYNGKVYTIPLDGDFHMVYYRKDILDKDGVAAAEDLGRLPHDRREVQRPGPQRRRRAGLRLVHRQEEGRPELLVDHLDRRRPAPGQGHQRRRVLRHVEHEPAVRPQRGDDQGARDVREDGDVRPARRAQHGRRRHPRPVHDRALRPVDGLGRHRHPDARHVRPGQDRRDDHAGLEGGPRPLHRQARRRATRPPAPTPSTASTTPRSPRSAAGPARSTPHRRRPTRTPRTTSCRT